MLLTSAARPKTTHLLQMLHTKCSKYESRWLLLSWVLLQPAFYRTQGCPPRQIPAPRTYLCAGTGKQPSASTSLGTTKKLPKGPGSKLALDGKKAVSGRLNSEPRSSTRKTQGRSSDTAADMAPAALEKVPQRSKPVQKQAPRPSSLPAHTAANPTPATPITDLSFSHTTTNTTSPSALQNSLMRCSQYLTDSPGTQAQGLAAEAVSRWKAQPSVALAHQATDNAAAVTCMAASSQAVEPLESVPCEADGWYHVLQQVLHTLEELNTDYCLLGSTAALIQGLALPGCLSEVCVDVQWDRLKDLHAAFCNYNPSPVIQQPAGRLAFQFCTQHPPSEPGRGQPQATPGNPVISTNSCSHTDLLDPEHGRATVVQTPSDVAPASTSSTSGSSKVTVHISATQSAVVRSDVHRAQVSFDVFTLSALFPPQPQHTANPDSLPKHALQRHPLTAASTDAATCSNQALQLAISLSSNKAAASGQSVWVKSLYALREDACYRHDHTTAQQISNHLALMQQQLARHNSGIWGTEDTYPAWVQRFGFPADAASKIQADPLARLSPLDKHFGLRGAATAVAGCRVANLLGSHGQKAVALALCGAHVTVVDVSAGNARYAAEVAAAAGIHCNVHNWTQQADDAPLQSPSQTNLGDASSTTAQDSRSTNKEAPTIALDTNCSGQSNSSAAVTNIYTDCSSNSGSSSSSSMPTASSHGAHSSNSSSQQQRHAAAHSDGNLPSHQQSQSPTQSTSGLDSAIPTGSLRYVLSDVLSLPSSELAAHYDYVLLEMGVLHYFIDLTPLMSGCVARLLAPGGRFILREFHPVSTKLITSKGKKHKVTGNYFDAQLVPSDVAFSKHLQASPSSGLTEQLDTPDSSSTSSMAPFGNSSSSHTHNSNSISSHTHNSNSSSRRTDSTSSSSASSKSLTTGGIQKGRVQPSGTEDVLLRRWTLGEVVTAVAQAGLTVRVLEEEGGYNPSDFGLPKIFTLVAEKPPQSCGM